MVEGPGCKLKGLKLKKRVKGQKVIGLSGNVFIKRSKTEKAIPSPFEQLTGLVLLDVKTLGKELFALFENDICLRVHFLMQGYVRYNNEPKEFGGGNASEPRLKLHMSEDEVAFFDCGVEIRSCAECVEKYDSLINLDICSPTFDAKLAVQTIMEHSERLVCDVILDQLVLPGVGNIIKNEALYDAGINPNTKVKYLNEELVSHLVKMNRDFTSIFYKCRKEGKDLRKHMRVYEKENCPECGEKLVRCKIGEYERLTFFCRSCQTNSIKTTKKLAMRNSLLGWVQANKIQVPWSCTICTLDNKPANNKCAACLTPKETSLTGVSPSFTERSPKPSVTSLGNQNLHLSPVMSTLTSSLTSPEAKAIGNVIYGGGKRLMEDTPDKTCKVGKYTFKRTSSASFEVSSPVLSSHQSHSRPSLHGPQASIYANDPDIQDYQKLASIASQDEDTSSQRHEEQILCSGHMKPVKKAVVKNGENKGRVFYACSLPQIKQCKFFKWADDHHPLCGHGKISVIRLVTKLNSNNGKQFYCCPLPKPRQCDFFEWANK